MRDLIYSADYEVSIRIEVFIRKRAQLESIINKQNLLSIFDAVEAVWLHNVNLRVFNLHYSINLNILFLINWNTNINE